MLVCLFGTLELTVTHSHPLLAKLKRIKTVASPLTAKKVAITSDQLSRRYNLIYSSLSTGSDRFNLLKVSRWSGEQDVLIRSSLQKAEPFPWLKHLDRRSRKQSGDENVRMPWHLSALIMEEYLHAQNARNRAMQSIPEHPSVSDPLGDLTSPFLISPIQDERPSLPTFPSPSRNSSARLSLSRHISAEGRVSFEPLLQPPQTRPSNESRRSVESTFSSIFSGSSAQNQKDRDRSIGVSSPASSRLYLKEGLGVRRKWANESDDGSSARNSPAEQSDDREEKSDQGDNINKRFGNGKIVFGGVIETSSDIQKEGEESFVHVDAIDLSFDKPTPPPPPPETAPAGNMHNAPRIINRDIRPINISLPSEDRIAFALEQKRRQEADEARADMEYDLKAQYVFFFISSSFFVWFLIRFFFCLDSWPNAKIPTPTSDPCLIVSRSISGNTKRASRASCPTRLDLNTRVGYHKTCLRRSAMTPRMSRVRQGG